MWKYYLRIIRELPKHFHNVVDAVLFWVAVVGLSVLTYLWPDVAALAQSPLPRWLPPIAIGVLVFWLFLHVNFDAIREAEQGRDDLSKQITLLSESKPRPRVEIVKGKRSHTDMYNIREEWGVRVHNDGAAALFMGAVEIVDDSGNPLERMDGRLPIDWHGTEVIKRHIMKGDYETLYFGYVETYPTMPQVIPRIMVRFFVENMKSRKDCFESSRIVGGPLDPFVIVDLTIYSDPAPVESLPRLRLRLSSAGMTST